MHLHFFNPENDLALANGDPNFVAPVSARKLASDLALLPKWWSEEGDELLGDAFDAQRITGCMPWGWSAYTRQCYLRAGVKDDLLPSEADLTHVRLLSHRRTAIQILQQLGTAVALPELPVELSSLDEVEDYIMHHPAGAVFKTPWSSSGKGLCWSERMNVYNRSLWFPSIFRKMKTVIAEPVYARIIDFAMLFSANGEGKVAFAGYSLFETDGQGAYVGNCLLSDEDICREIARFVDLKMVEQIKMRLEDILSGLVESLYKGLLGVDMMIVRNPQGAGYMLHPCVELNLRMTMGGVARLFYDKYMKTGKGKFRIYFSSVKGELYQRMINGGGADAVWENGILKSGMVWLTPVREETQYAAIVEVED